MTHFHPATAADIPALLPMTAELYAQEGCPFDPAGARRALEEMLPDPRLGRAWLLRATAARSGDCGPNLGYLVLTFGFIVEFHGRHAVVDELYLRPAARGQGHGRRALAFVEEYCRGQGIRVLRLEVERENTRAQAVYHAAGFRAHDRWLMTRVLDGMTNDK